MTDIRGKTTYSMPKVVCWFRAYCWVLTSFFLLLVPVALLKPVDQLSERMLVLGALMGYIAIFGIPLVAGRKPWMYKYGRIVIILSLCSVTFPLAIVMLGHWRNLDVKVHYGLCGEQEPDQDKLDS